MSRHAETIREVLSHSVNGEYSRELAARALLELEAENQQLRDAIEEYLLWEPCKRGHAEAHRKLAAAVRVEERP
jgi:hypothetical protein